MTDIVPPAVSSRVLGDLMDQAKNASAELAASYAGLMALTLVSRHGAVAQAAKIIGDFLSVILTASDLENGPLDVPETVVAALKPYATITGTILPTRIPLPPISRGGFADGYRAGRHSLAPFIDYSKFTGRIDERPKTRKSR
jgi:hypothetical protein